MAWAKRATFHRCPAFGCQKDVPNKPLMCFLHWKIVPLHLQTTIKEQWSYGVANRCHPTQAYSTALGDALKIVRHVLEARQAKAMGRNLSLGAA